MGGGGSPPAAGGRGGGGLVDAGGGRAPTPRQGLPGDLVQEVPVGAGVDAAEDVWPPGCGPDLPRLRQGGPPDVGEPGEEGVHPGGHLPLGRRGLGVGGGGGGAGGRVVVPHPAPPVHRHGVGPAGGRLCLEEGEAAAWAEVLPSPPLAKSRGSARRSPGWGGETVTK